MNMRLAKMRQMVGMIITQGMKLEITVMRSMMAWMTMIRWRPMMARKRVLPHP
jgi:hypothetical protein